MTLYFFPDDNAGSPRILTMTCAECGAEPTIFVVHPDTSITAFCSPPCAAGCGVAPWARADLITRMSWSERQPAPTKSAPDSDGADAAGDAAGFLDVSSLNLVTAPGHTPTRGHPFW